MKKYRFLLVLSVLFLPAIGFGQSISKISQGALMPNISFNHVINGGLPQLSDYKGKLVIIDFWSRGCGACVASFPRMEQINKNLEGKAIIIPVMRENINTFNGLKKISRVLVESKLPFVFSDTMLHHLFPHRYVPYYALISKDGRFMGTTNYITEDMVRQVLATGIYSRLYESKQAKRLKGKVNFQSEKLNLMERKLNGIEYYSIIKKRAALDSIRYSQAYLFSMLRDSLSGREIGYLTMASPIIDIICKAYKIGAPSEIFIGDPQLLNILSPKDKTKREAWLKNNMYHVEIMADPDKYPDFYNESMYECLRHDLQEYFGISGVSQLVKRPCYVLKKLGTKDTIKLNLRYRMQNDTPRNIAEYTKEGIYLEDAPVRFMGDLIADKLNSNRKLDFPWVNETGWTDYDVKLDAYIRCSDLQDMELINAALKEFGLQIILADRLVKTVKLSKVDELAQKIDKKTFNFFND